MKMETNGCATQYVAEDVHPSCTLSQLEMDAVGVLLEFTPLSQLQEYSVLQWSGKRKRSHRLGNFDYKGEEFHTACNPAFGEGETCVPRNRALINAEREKFSNNPDARAKSPNSPLPSLQVADCMRTFGLGAWAIASPPQKILCKQLLKFAMSLAWEIKSMRQKKSLLLEELHSLKNQNFQLKQQHLSTTKAIQTTDAPRSSSLRCSAVDQCTQLQHSGVMQEVHERAEGFKDSASGNSNASVPFTPSTIALNSQNLTECTLKDPNCVLRTSPRKDVNVLEEQAEAIADQHLSAPTRGDVQVPSTSTANIGFAHTMSQTGTHAVLSFSNEHGFIDAHGTWVIAPERLENCVNGVHPQYLKHTCEDSNHYADGVRTQTAANLQCVDDVPAQQTAPHHYTNRCVDSVPSQLTASPQNLNQCAQFHPKAPPQGVNCHVDGISVQSRRFPQSVNRHADNTSVQLPSPPKILSNGALAQLASPSGTHAIILLYDRKFAFAEARRRRKEITGIKRRQVRASRQH